MVDDVGFNLVRPQPACEPEAVTSRLVCDDDALDYAAVRHSLIAPAMQQPQEPCRIRVKLLQRLTRDTWNDAGDQPTRQAQLDDGDQGGPLNKGREGSAQIIQLWHRALLLSG